MAEWTNDARDYLDAYLKQVAMLAREQGDDPDEIVDGLRDHISNEVESGDAGPITVGRLLPVLSELGAPEEVASVDVSTLKLAPSKAPTMQPSMPVARPPVPPKKTKSVVVHRHRSPLSCVLAIILAGVAGLFVLAIVGILAAIILPALSRVDEAVLRERAAEERAMCQTHLKAVGEALIESSRNGDEYLLPVDLKYSTVMFNIDEIVPDNIDKLSTLTCPSGPHAGETFDDVASEYDFEYDYVYCSHAVTNEQDFLAYLDAVAAAKQSKAPLTGPIQLESGAEIFRLQLPESYVGPVSPEDIPILIERPGRHEHPSGYNVLFMDGRVEFGTVSEDRFPWTQDVAAALADSGKYE